MTKAERTRQFILEKTAPLFNTRGFEGTSLSDLTNATGLTKGSIYGNFTDKEEIAREAFLYSIRKVRETSLARMQPRSSNKEKLLALLEFFEEYVLTPPIDGGCPLLNKAIEADDHHLSMRKLVAAELQHTVNVIVTLLNDGKKCGEFNSKINSEELAFLFFCSIEGAIMFSRVSSSKKAMKIVTESIRSILETNSN